MTNALQVFDFNENAVRVIMKDDQPWFVAKDICEYFGDTNYKRSLARLDEDERGLHEMTTPGGTQKMNVVNESGLYHLLFNFEPTEARGVSEEYIKERQDVIKKFKRWVTHEVLPAIRKTGSYSMGEKLRELDIQEAKIIQSLLFNPDSELSKTERRKLSLSILAKLEKSEVSLATGKKFYTHKEIAEELNIEPSWLLQQASINSLLMHGYKYDDSDTWYFTPKGRDELIHLFTKGPRKKKKTSIDLIGEKWKAGWKDLGWE